MEHKLELLMTTTVTHDVRRFVFTRPEGFEFDSGQAVELALDDPDWRDEGRPFTPTSLAEDRVLEFTIKGYAEHDGVTKRLHQLRPGATVHMSEPFGTITWEGPGVFLAGGAGITPFLSILRRLQVDGKLAGNTLIFSNKTPNDMICEQELRGMLGDRCILTATDVDAPGYEHRFIDKAYLQETIQDFSQHFYVCGPSQMVKDLRAALEELGATPTAVVFEE